MEHEDLRLFGVRMPRYIPVKHRSQFRAAHNGLRLWHLHYDDATVLPAYNGFFTTTVLTDYCFGLGGVIIGTTLGAYVFMRIPNRIFRYIVYAYIAISGVIILMTN